VRGRRSGAGGRGRRGHWWRFYGEKGGSCEFCSGAERFLISKRQFKCEIDGFLLMLRFRGGVDCSRAPESMLLGGHLGHGTIDAEVGIQMHHHFSNGE
jgi:hypothetical protein